MWLTRAMFKLPIRFRRAPKSFYFEDHYSTWNTNRYLEIMKSLGGGEVGTFNILEISAGYANLGRYFLELGCDVTCTDGRAEYVQEMRTRYPSIKAEVLNLEDLYPLLPKFNVVIHFGVLYHLADPLRHFDNFLSVQDFDHLFLETEVSNYSDPNFVLKIKEEGYDQALNGIGGRPTSAGIERILSKHNLEFRRIDSTSLNSPPHSYDWNESETLETYRIGMRRFWHITKISGKIGS